MQMIVRTVDKERLWSFTVNEKILYDLLCNSIAWHVFSRSGKDKDQVAADTVALAATSHKRSDEDLAAISDPFIRAVLQERKRLGLDDFQYQDE